MPQVSLGEAITEVSTRLGDPNNTFFLHDEIYLYLAESLRCFQSLTGFWKEEFVLTLTPPFATNWFPANDVGSPRQPTLTDTDLYTLIEYHLLEPPSGATWTGTNQFGIDDLWQSMSRRRNEMLQLAACNMVELSLSCIPNTNTVPIPDSALDVRRVRWVPAVNQGDPVTLQRGDVLSFQRFTPNYLQTNTNPMRWDILSGQEAPGAVDTLLALVLDTLVNVPSKVEALAIAGAPDFDPNIGPPGMPLLIPDDWAWVLKFGALADILSKEEEGRDVERATYCRKRYDEGLELMITMPWLSQALLNGVAVDTPALASADRFNYEWQSRSTAFPGIVVGGIDLFAVSPVPTALTSVEMTVVRNAPVPINDDTKPIFLARDATEAVLKEAQHLALLKCGGAEFSESLALHQEFITFCVQTNKRLEESGIFPSDYRSVSPKQEEQQPRFAVAKG
jgi:hypothetical protein